MEFGTKGSKSKKKLFSEYDIDNSSNKTND